MSTVAVEQAAVSRKEARMGKQRTWPELSLSLPLHIVFYRADGDVIAHCLEFNLLGDGKDKEQALDQLAEAIELQVEASIELDDPDNLICPADREIFQRYAAGTPVADGLLHRYSAKLLQRSPQFAVWEARAYDVDHAVCGDLVTR
jgi:hypothetical protein